MGLELFPGLKNISNKGTPQICYFLMNNFPFQLKSYIHYISYDYLVLSLQDAKHEFLLSGSPAYTHMGQKGSSASNPL